MRELNDRMYAYACSAAFVMSCLASPVSASPFDGSWNMLVTTTSGHCGKIKVGLAVNRGRISSTTGSFALHRIRIDGLISAGPLVGFEPTVRLSAQCLGVTHGGGPFGSWFDDKLNVMQKLAFSSDRLIGSCISWEAF